MRARIGYWSSLALGCCLTLSAGADQIRFDTVPEWRQWQLPLGAVELTRDGTIRPVRIRRDINAVLNAADFGGGIRDAGSNPGQAPSVMDGDPTTGWGPDPDDSPEDWFIEIDLGRAVAARRVTLIFAEEAPPFELFTLFLSTGEPAIDVVANVVEGSLIYRSQARFKENKNHQTTLELDPVSHPLVQFLRVQVLTHVPGAQLVEVEVEAIGDNMALGLLEKGGDLEIILDVEGFGDEIPLGNARAIIDGNFSMWLQHRRINRNVNVISHITLDLGAVYWTDLVRIVADFVHSPGQFRFNFDTYEVLTSDGSLAPNGTLIWDKQFAGRATGQNRRLGIANHHFPPIQTRYVRIVWVFWDAACAAACVNCGIVPPCQFWGETRELQVFGEGHPARVSFRSPLIDLEGDKQVNTIRWGGDAPAGTWVELRSRTGNELQHDITYYDKNGKEVTERKWEKLIPSFRGPVDTTSVPGDDWSPWSNIYLTSGEAFQSPSPRRFMELQVGLVSETPGSAATLDFVEIEFSKPLADEVMGEIFPIAVIPGEPTEFSYFVFPERISGEGFDRLAVEASTAVRFKDAFVGKERIEAEVETTAAGFQVTLPRPIRSRELVELRFESSVFVDATRFDLFLEDSRQDETVRQRVEPGDAVSEVESSTNVVRLPMNQRLFANAEVPGAVTPNGDGRNDVLIVSVDLVNVLELRLLRLRVFDLSGRLVREMGKEVRAGLQELSWDGRDAGSRLVPPGLYLLELHIDGDGRAEKVRWVVSVAY